MGLSLKDRIMLWVVIRKLKKLHKEALKMTPLPKWAGWLGTLIAVLPVVWEAYNQGGWKAALMALLTALGAGTTLVSHSATGTGGTPKNP